MLQNKTFGSALIIAGTTIGAGMLAMPLTSAGMGFGYTVLLLVGLWALLVYSGLLFVEVYQTAEQLDDGVASLAEKYFGRFRDGILAIVEFVNFTLCTFSRLYYGWRIFTFRLANSFWNGSDVAENGDYYLYCGIRFFCRCRNERCGWFNSRVIYW